MEIVIKPSKRDTSILNKLGFTYLDFDSRFNLWRKSLTKKSKLNTPEIFSLNYNSLLSDLKKSLFLFIDRKDDINLIKSKFNIIEYNEMDIKNSKYF